MFFIFLFIILFLVITSLIIIYYSKIEIELNNLDISSLRKKQKILPSYKIIIFFTIFKNIRIIKKEIKEIKKINKDIEKISKEYKKNSKVNLKDILKIIKIQDANLEIEIGFEDAALTAISVGSLYGILGVTLGSKIKENTDLKIKPIYMQKNLIELKLDITIEIEIKELTKAILKNKINK